MTNQQIIFILGHQRSGTSAIASLLAAATGRRLVDDPKWTYADSIIKLYKGQLPVKHYFSAHWKDLDTTFLKAPGLTLIADKIQQVFPAARFVVVVRDPRDTVAAVLEWRCYRDRRPRFDFWDHRWLGISTDDRIQLLAERWNRYIEFAGRLSAPIWVRYEDFCKDKQGTIKSLCDSLQLPSINPIDDLKNKQFKKSFGDKKIRGPNRWQGELCPGQVTTIVRTCTRHMRRFDYPTE